MKSIKRGSVLLLLILIVVPDVRMNGDVSAAAAGSIVRSALAQSDAPGVETISADELRKKLERNEPVTVLDVRETNSYLDSGNKIKGAIHVKLRRLRSRLSVPPMKGVPRDGEIVTYCACPNDEAGIEAAHVLLAAGFKHVRVLKGGWRVWLKANGPLEAKPKG
jgi:rhodanese-related sulfurtransferase